MKNENTVAVAMSGGVDSGVSAYLALQQGFEVVGIFLKMHDAPTDPELYSCCRKLGIKLIERDCRKLFYDNVLLPSAKEYVTGRTPNPCCDCNMLTKFAALFNVADELGIEKVWTGHYAQIIAGELHKGVDQAKDQSYFLYRLSREALSRVHFPLGKMCKSEVRRIAAEADLPCAVRPESQDACFQLPNECCGETLRRICGLEVKAGNFIHQGKIVGRHNGIHRYTIGQRQGLNVALGVPAYICKISAESGDIELTTDSERLLTSEFFVRNLNWQSHLSADRIDNLSVRIRYRSPGEDCVLERVNEQLWHVKVSKPLRAVTPGQAAVFYAEDTVLGGGVIYLNEYDV